MSDEMGGYNVPAWVTGVLVALAFAGRTVMGWLGMGNGGEPKHLHALEERMSDKIDAVGKMIATHDRDERLWQKDQFQLIQALSQSQQSGMEQFNVRLTNYDKLREKEEEATRDRHKAMLSKLDDVIDAIRSNR